MRNQLTLIEAVLDTYDRPDLTPRPDGTTFCNVAVAAVASAMGCGDLNGKTADQMVSFLDSSTDWSDVPMEKAQDMANQGSLLVAGLDSKALNQAHGHVAVIRPGKVCYSGKWGATPRVLNIGAENFIARAKRGVMTNLAVGLNEAFAPPPKIWVWRPSL
jgi:hypothetical protein